MDLLAAVARRPAGLVEPSASSYLHLVGGLGPAVAALVVTAAVAGRSGLAVFDIVTTTPTTTTLIPTLMGAVITLAWLAVIPSLARAVGINAAQPEGTS